MTPEFDPKWPYTKRHRKVHLKQSAKEIREQRVQLTHRLIADAWDMPLEEVMMDSVLREGEMR